MKQDKKNIKTKRIRFDYYKCNRYDEKTGNFLPFDLCIFLNDIDKYSLSERNIYWYGEIIRLDDFWFDDAKKVWYLDFVRFRNTDPNTVKENSKSKHMNLPEDEYIGENIYALYDQKKQVFMVQNNRNAFGISGAIFYINQFYYNFGYPEKAGVRFDPIQINLEDSIFAKSETKKIRLNFANTDKNPVENENNGIRKIVKLLTDAGGITGELIISVGRSKKRLSNDYISEMISEIWRQGEKNDLIKKAELNIKEEGESEFEVIDLFNNRLNSIIYKKYEGRIKLVFKGDLDDEMYINYNNSRKYFDS